MQFNYTPNKNKLIKKIKTITTLKKKFIDGKFQRGISHGVTKELTTSQLNNNRSAYQKGLSRH